MAASRVDAHIKRMDVEYISVREIHRLHIPLGLEGCHAFTTNIFLSRNQIEQKGSPKCLSSRWLSKEILLPTQMSAAGGREGWISMFPLLDWVLLSQKLLEAEM